MNNSCNHEQKVSLIITTSATRVMSSWIMVAAWVVRPRVVATWVVYPRVVVTTVMGPRIMAACMMRRGVVIIILIRYQILCWLATMIGYSNMHVLGRQTGDAPIIVIRVIIIIITTGVLVAFVVESLAPFRRFVFTAVGQTVSASVATALSTTWEYLATELQRPANQPTAPFSIPRVNAASIVLLAVYPVYPGLVTCTIALLHGRRLIRRCSRRLSRYHVRHFAQYWWNCT